MCNDMHCVNKLCQNVGYMNLMSQCDVTNSAHPVIMTTIHY